MRLFVFRYTSTAHWLDLIGTYYSPKEVRILNTNKRHLLYNSLIVNALENIDSPGFLCRIDVDDAAPNSPVASVWPSALTLTEIPKSLLRAGVLDLKYPTPSSI